VQIPWTVLLGPSSLDAARLQKMPGQRKKIALFHWILVFFSVFVGFFVAQPTLFRHPSGQLPPASHNPIFGFLF